VRGVDKPTYPTSDLEKAPKIDKKLSFKGKCSNVVMDSHVNERLLIITV
jgi:hypothetical protein